MAPKDTNTLTEDDDDDTTEGQVVKIVEEKPEGEQDEKDTRLSDTGDDDEAEREKIKAAKREERKHRRIYKREDRAKDRELAELRAKLADVAQRQTTVDNRLTQSDLAELDRRINEAANIYNAAVRNHEAAVKAGDGPAATQAVQAMITAKAAYDQGVSVKTAQGRTTTVAAKAVSEPAETKVPKTLAKRVTAFFDKFDWVEAPGSPDVDKDSRIVHRLDAEITAEGYEQDSDEYWEELEDRMKSEPKLAKHFDGSEDDEPAPRQKTSGKKGPSIGGARNGYRAGDRVGKDGIYATAAMRAAADEAGYVGKDRDDYFKRVREARSREDQRPHR